MPPLHFLHSDATRLGPMPLNAADTNRDTSAFARSLHDAFGCSSMISQTLAPGSPTVAISVSLMRAATRRELWTKGYAGFPGLWKALPLPPHFPVAAGAGAEAGWRKAGDVIREMLFGRLFDAGILTLGRCL